MNYSSQDQNALTPSFSDEYSEGSDNTDFVAVKLDDSQLFSTINDSCPRGPNVSMTFINNSEIGNNAIYTATKIEDDFTSNVDPLSRLSSYDTNNNELILGSDPNWAIGAYSTSVGNSKEATTW